MAVLSVLLYDFYEENKLHVKNRRLPEQLTEKFASWHFPRRRKSTIFLVEFIIEARGSFDDASSGEVIIYHIGYLLHNYLFEDNTSNNEFIIYYRFE